MKICYRSWVGLLVATRQFLSIVLVGIFILSSCAAHADDNIPVEISEFLREEEGIEVMTVTLTDEEFGNIEAVLGVVLDAKSYDVYIGKIGDKVNVYALKVIAWGLHGPIEFLASINTDGYIENMIVHKSVEIRGKQIEQKRFLKQFLKKGLKNKLKIGKDIQAVTGATISSAAAAIGAKKALLIFEVFKARL